MNGLGCWVAQPYGSNVDVTVLVQAPGPDLDHVLLLSIIQLIVANPGPGSGAAPSR